MKKYIISDTKTSAMLLDDIYRFYVECENNKYYLMGKTKKDTIVRLGSYTSEKFASNALTLLINSICMFDDDVDYYEVETNQKIKEVYKN